MTDDNSEELFQKAVAAHKRGDHAESVKCAEIAADSGHGRAMELLGAIYSLNGDAMRNSVLAHKWFALAVENLRGTDYWWMRDEAIRSRNWVASMMTPAELLQAEKLAHEWMSNYIKKLR